MANSQCSFSSFEDFKKSFCSCEQFEMNLDCKPLKCLRIIVSRNQFSVVWVVVAYKERVGLLRWNGGALCFFTIWDVYVECFADDCKKKYVFLKKNWACKLESWIVMYLDHLNESVKMLCISIEYRLYIHFLKNLFLNLLCLAK